MFIELDAQQYEVVRQLLQPLAAYNVSIMALLDATNPGRIFVDNADTPQSAFLQTVEGFYICGQSTNDAFNAKLKNYFETSFHPQTTIGVEISSMDWKTRLPQIFAPRTIESLARRHYICTGLTYTDWQHNLAEGLSVWRIDADLLNNPALTIPEDIHRWVDHNWGSHEHFLNSGFGFCTVHDNQVVSWSIADCISGVLCEIGIRTHEDYRRQGLAAITAAAAVDYALTYGYNSVGWHCDADNIGSWKTAEKVGFTKERDYFQYYAVSSVSNQDNRIKLE